MKQVLVQIVLLYMHLKKHCPFVTPLDLNTCLGAVVIAETTLEFLFGNDLKDGFLGPLENQHHQFISTGHSIGLIHFLPLILFFCLSPLRLVCSHTPLPIDSLSFNEHSFEDKLGFPTPC